MKTIIATIFFSLIFVEGFAQQDWMPYVPNPNIVIPTPTFETPYIPQAIYNPPRQLIFTYELVPYYVNKPIVIEQRGLFYRHQYLVYQPIVEWFYRPVWK